jgi:hypothetical protein
MNQMILMQASAQQLASQRLSVGKEKFMHAAFGVLSQGKKSNLYGRKHAKY